MPNDVAPPKGKRVWCVKAVWKNSPCYECMNDIQFHCEKEEIEVPTPSSSQFLAPYVWLTAKCPHESSPHPKEPAIRSIYEGV